MTDREKLIALVHVARLNALWHNAQEPSKYIADMLIANGVVVREKGEWTEHRHTSYDDLREEDVVWFTYVCSLCGGEPMNDYDFCPFCGADMRKGEKNNA